MHFVINLTIILCLLLGILFSMVFKDDSVYNKVKSSAKEPLTEEQDKKLKSCILKGRILALFCLVVGIALLITKIIS